MSVSTDALLYFGFTFFDSEGSPDKAPWDELGPDPDEEEPDCDDWLFVKLSGSVRPTISYEAPGGADAWRAWWKAKRNFLDALPIEVIVHCSNDYPIYAICVKESYRRAWRGQVIQIGKTIDADEAWDRLLRDHCEKLGISYQDPTWELVSYWG